MMLRVMELKLKERELNIMANESGAKIMKMESDAVATVHNAQLNRDREVLYHVDNEKNREVKLKEIAIKKEVLAKKDVVGNDGK